MRPLVLSASEARRFLVLRHLLDPPRRLPATRASVLEVVQRLGSLQFDPLEVPGARNHDLVLFARIAGYQRAWCDAFLYAPRGERRLFEAYNKSLNILPIDELPYYRIAWERAHERYRATILAERSEAVREILDRLQSEGPLSPADFRGRLATRVDWHWAPTAEGRAVLEALFESGRVGISRRDGNRRSFDLVERLFPEDLLARRVPQEASIRHRLLSRIRGLGLLGPSASPELLVGTGKALERTAMVQRLVEEGTLVPAHIEGVRGVRYLLSEERPLLENAIKNAPSREVTFLAPLDPLLWDRRLLRELFGFDYIWEVYVPEAKRRYGYYVLPILFGDRIVGRIEPRMDREKMRLSIVGVTFEEGFSPLSEPGFVPAFATALEAYMRFVGAAKVGFPRSRIAAALGREVNRHFDDGGEPRTSHTLPPSPR